jgi:hypothetical protein
MKRRFSMVFCTVVLGVIVFGPATEYAHARGGRGGFRGGGGFHGFRGGGGFHGFRGGEFHGFSRESPAAAGSFASRAGAMEGRAGGFQANRQQYKSGAQASRQQEANRLQSSREQTAQGLQSNAQQYRGSYPYGAYGYPNWDAGAGLAAATAGAALGAAAASARAPSTSAGSVASQPCAAPENITVEGMTYFRCGSAWYTQAYGPAGPTFMPVSPPAGL